MDAGQDYAASVGRAFRRIADATAGLKPHGVAVVLTIGVHPRFDLGRLGPDRFRAAHPMIGLRIMEPAGLHELVEGKVDALIDRGLGHHPGYRCDRLQAGSGVGEYLICPEGTADCREIESLRIWLHSANAGERVFLFESRRKQNRKCDFIELNADPERSPVRKTVLRPRPIRLLGGDEPRQHAACIFDLACSDQRKAGFDAIARPHKVITSQAVA